MNAEKLEPWRHIFYALGLDCDDDVKQVI